MRAIEYRKSVPRYALLKLLGRRFRGLCTGGVSPAALRNVAEPKLPTPEWVRVAPTLTGVCGSDLATLCATNSPYLAPVTSMPFVMGHETVGTVVEVGAEAQEWRVGERVVLRPALGCTVRGIAPPCDACASGRDALCRNVTRGAIAPGIQTGFCRDTGGGLGEALVAHESQLYRVPDDVPDRWAVLIEPFACALHGALKASPGEKDTVLVIGCGAIGLLTVAALRATGCRSHIVAVAKHDHQQRLATELGANALLDVRGSVADRYARWAKELDAVVLDPELGKPTVVGGSAVTFDCVASSASIDDGLRFTRGGGTFVLVGMPGVAKNVDWTPMWFKELTVRAAYAYGPERRADGVVDTFDVAIELMRTWGERLQALVGKPYPLSEYRAAFRSALDTGQSRVVKTVFAVHNAPTS